MKLLGIDLGGTKTAVCVGNEQGDIAASQRIPTRTPEGPDAWQPRCFDLVERVLDEAGCTAGKIDAIGISAPGPLCAQTGTLLYPPNMLGWENVPLYGIFSEQYGKPVYVNNDANAGVLAEWYFGEYKGEHDLVFLTMSTGLGAGIIAAGHLIQGVTDMAGEVGYHVLDIQGPESPCGHRGSFEAYCGGKNVAERLRKNIQKDHIPTSILRQAKGSAEQINFEAFLAAVREGDPYATREWETYVLRLAQGIGNLIMILNPGAILLGTIAIHAGPLLLDPLHEKLKDLVGMPQALENCRIAPSSLGTDFGHLAALAIAREGLRQASGV